MLCDPDGAPVEVSEALLSTEYGPDGVQRRATLELWIDGEEGQPLRGAGTLISSSSIEPPRPRPPRSPSSAGRSRAARASATTRSSAPMAERIEAVISDFGGVLTTPLIESFMAFQDETGITTENLGKAMQASAEDDGENPLFELERGEITEAAFLEQLADGLEPLLGHRPGDAPLQRDLLRGAATEPGR